jgi:anaerobic ribonucleoside-triphosphate reductase activating protein
MKVQIAGIIKESVTDGLGLRTTIFFQGCEHRCLGCHNPQTWNFQGGNEYELEDLLCQLPDSPLFKGITLSGGDPFYQPLAAAHIARKYKKAEKDVWTYTGFTWEELLSENNPDRLDLLKNSDVLVDGPFIQSKLTLDLPFRGSSNQRLIAVRDSLESGKVVEIVLK